MEDSLKKCSVKIARLTDFSYEGGISAKYISTIVSINSSIIEKNNLPELLKLKIPGNHYIFRTIIFGFLIILVLPRITVLNSTSYSKGYLDVEHPTIHAPPVNYYDYNPLIETIDKSIAKMNDGNTKLKN